MKYLEDKMCIEFKHTMEQNIKIDPLFKNLVFFHIPNGGWRTKQSASKFKAMGVLPGVSDYFIVRKAGDYNGLWLEFKTAKNSLSLAQKAFISAVQREGYKAQVVRSVKEAIQVIVKYLEKGE
jgi:hypothetical protein